MNEPLDLCLRIIEARAYAETKREMERHASDGNMEVTPLVDLIQEIGNEVEYERMKALRNGTR